MNLAIDLFNLPCQRCKEVMRQVPRNAKWCRKCVKEVRNAKRRKARAKEAKR